MIIQSKAIVIKSFPYGDSSLISRVLIENGQKLSIMIKGAKSLKSNKTALFQSMNFINMNYYNKETRSIQLFKEGSLIDGFNYLKSNFDIMKYSLCIIDIIDKVLPKNYKDKIMFEITYKCLSCMSNKYDYRVIFIFFLLSFSHYNGYSINELEFNSVKSDRALDLFIQDSENYHHIVKLMEGIDLDELIRKTLSFIQSYIPEINHAKSLKFLN